MNKTEAQWAELEADWKKEAEAPFVGFDFSYLQGRKLEAQLPWSYDERVKQALPKAQALLDLGTAGGEKLLAFQAHWPDTVCVTEDYPPNLKLARQRLEPLGVSVVDAQSDLLTHLPFEDAQFDLIISRHTAYNSAEIERLLQPGGYFLTQQVDGRNLSDLSALFGVEQPWTYFTLDYALDRLKNETALVVEEAMEWTSPTEFLDIGALVYFLKAIPWTSPDFSVDKDLAILQKLQGQLEEAGSLSFVEKRFLILARKAV